MDGAQAILTRRIGAMSAAILGATILFFAFQTESAKATISGTVGAHSVGWTVCDTWSGHMNFYTPNLYAVDAHSGINNDFQHVSWTVYLYRETSPNTFTYTGWSSGSWTSWGPGGRVAYDNAAALTGDPGTVSFPIGSHGRYMFIVSESWYDRPSYYYGYSTHNTVTGSVIENAGLCSF